MQQKANQLQGKAFVLFQKNKNNKTKQKTNPTKHNDRLCPCCGGNIKLDSKASKEEIKITTWTDKTEKQVEPWAAAPPSYQLFCWLPPSSGSQAATAEFIIHFKYIGEKQRLKRRDLTSYPENAGEAEMGGFALLKNKKIKKIMKIKGDYDKPRKKRPPTHLITQTH